MIKDPTSVAAKGGQELPGRSPSSSAAESAPGPSAPGPSAPGPSAPGPSAPGPTEVTRYDGALASAPCGRRLTRLVSVPPG
jgi:hypothetical protein